jgi:hypothetical protein
LLLWVWLRCDVVLVSKLKVVYESPKSTSLFSSAPSLYPTFISDFLDNIFFFLIIVDPFLFGFFIYSGYYLLTIFKSVILFYGFYD